MRQAHPGRAGELPQVQTFSVGWQNYQKTTKKVHLIIYFLVSMIILCKNGHVQGWVDLKRAYFLAGLNFSVNLISGMQC